MKERVNITIERELLDRLDAAAASQHTTRSALVRRVMRAYVEGPTAGVETQPVSAAAGLAAETPGAYAPGALARPGPRALDEIAPLLRSFFAARDDVATTWVFGSIARGQTWARSDIDIAVLPADQTLSRRACSDLRTELAGRLSDALRADVDVVVFGQGSTLLWQRIVSEGVIVYGEGVRSAEATMRAVSAHLDFGHVLEEADRYWEEKVAGYDALR